MTKLNLVQDAPDVHQNKNLIRRRFYLSKEALVYLDSLALSQNKSPSILLDLILVSLSQKQKQ